MNSKNKREKRHHTKKENKLMKLISPTSDSDGDESEHELSHYLNDRVKLMKEVLRIIKPKKIKSMAPDCMKNMDIEEINSILLEELLGISNKRLRYIFNGQNLNEESSSTDPEDQVDVISLDDISDDDLIIDLDSDRESTKRKKKHKNKVKDEQKRRKVKKEKHDKEPQRNKVDEINPVGEKNLMSVLELLELQARARAIKSQLALESKKTKNDKEKTDIPETCKKEEDDDEEDAVIVESPKNVEIVITSSESEDELNKDLTNNKEVDKNGSVINSREESLNGDSQNKEDNKDLENSDNQLEVTLEANKNNEKVNETEVNKNDNINTDQQVSVTQEKEKINETERKISDKKLRAFKCKLKSIQSEKELLGSPINKKVLQNEDNHSSDDGEGIIINLEQNEMDCINLD